MDGFFYKEEEKPKRVTKAKALNCDSCGLYKTCHSPKMQYTGEGKLEILALAEAPGKKEDEKGIQLIGESGQELRDRLKKNHRILLDRDLYKTNAVICRPPNNATPTNRQIACCRSHLKATIEKLKPKKIICFGNVALKGLIDHKESVGDGLSKWTGWKIPDQEYKAWVYVNYHPAYLIRNEKDKALSNYFDKVLKEAIEHDEEFPIVDPEINIIYDAVQIKEKLESIIKHESIFTFDYEATGLRPYRAGHKIICVSIATDKETIAFPFDLNACYVSTFKKLLIATGIRKVAQNIKYEDLWSNIILGVQIKNWYWDTMQAAHIIDNRPGITGLKFQTYVNFGMAGYEDEIESYLKLKPDQDIYGFNRIEEYDLDKTLYYCGLDSYYEHKLFRKQLNDPELARNLNGFDLIQQGTLRLKETEKYGVMTNQEYYKEKYTETDKVIKGIERRIYSSDEVKIWNKHENTKLDLKSPTQLKKLLYTYCNYEVKKKTAKDNASTDGEALQAMNTPFTKNIIRLRKYLKINDTYIKNFIEQSYDNLLHASINLHSVRSYRSSYADPNLQNVPKHDEAANRLVRSGIIPRKGRRILEIDYKGSEVKASACYHHDPMMIKYINDKTTDMHRDTAIELFLTQPDEVDKLLFFDFRYWAKNNFVFAEFYGDWYKACATHIWKEILRSPHCKEILKLLKSKGIKNYYDFEDNARVVEDNLWNVRFKDYTKWKIKTYEEYLETLEIKLLTGFVCKGYMSKNDVLNYQIHGTSFHFLLWSYIRLFDYLQANKFESQLILEIHDSMLIDTIPDEETEIIKVAKKIMCEDIRQYWKWIIVPLDIEIEATNINGNWAEKEEIKIA